MAGLRYLPVMISRIMLSSRKAAGTRESTWSLIGPITTGAGFQSIQRLVTQAKDRDCNVLYWAGFYFGKTRLELAERDLYPAYQWDYRIICHCPRKIQTSRMALQPGRDHGAVWVVHKLAREAPVEVLGNVEEETLICKDLLSTVIPARYWKSPMMSFVSPAFVRCPLGTLARKKPLRSTLHRPHL